MNVAELFVKCLEEHNVKRIYGVPGEENLALLEAINNSSIDFTVTRNEQVAVFLAATHGRLTGQAGVALATLGAGATNMMTGIAQAQLEGFPVLVITGQKPLKKSKQGQFQVLDVVGMMKPITKFSSSVVDEARLPSALAQAFLFAESERPGAVHIELPEDIASENANGYKPIVYEKIRRPVPDEKAIKSIINKLEEAKKPIILIGGGANRKRVTKYLTKFIEMYNIPFFTSQMGKGVVDERLKEYVGTAATTDGDYIHDLIAKSDLIIAVGHDSVEKPTNHIEKEHTDIIHINFFAAKPDELYKPSLQVVGDIGNTFRQLCKANIDQSSWQLTPLLKEGQKIKEIINTNAQKQKGLTKGVNSNSMTPGPLIKELREVLDEKDIVALDNGLYKVWFSRNYPTYHPNTLLLDNALGSMGSGYATALATKIHYPERNIIAVIGDGGLLMQLGDLETAVRTGENITIIVLNDGSYGMIKNKQEKGDFTEFGLDFGNPDFVKLAESFGASGYRLDNTNDFTKIIKKALNEDGVSLIEIPFLYPKEIA